MPLEELDLLLEEGIGKTQGLELLRRRKAHLPIKELRLFTSALAKLLQGGVPLLRALQVIRKEAKRKSFQGILESLKERIEEGQSLSEALRRLEALPTYIPPLIEAGELSGSLPLILLSLSHHLEKEEERRRKIREALAYPSLVLGLGMVTLFILLQVVIPKLSLLYEDFGGTLPGVTRVILKLRHFTFPSLLFFIFSLITFLFFLRRKKELLFSLLLQVPFVGKLLQQNLLQGFASLLSLELGSGIPILQAMESVGKSASLPSFQKELEEVKEALAQGEKLSEALRNRSWISETTLALLASGEESGKLPEALAEIAKETEQEIDSQAHFLLKLLEPALILGIGILVGFLVIGALLPILEMNELIK